MSHYNVVAREQALKLAIDSFPRPISPAEAPDPRAVVAVAEHYYAFLEKPIAVENASMAAAQSEKATAGSGL